LVCAFPTWKKMMIIPSGSLRSLLQALLVLNLSHNISLWDLHQQMGEPTMG